MCPSSVAACSIAAPCPQRIATFFVNRPTGILRTVCLLGFVLGTASFRGCLPPAHSGRGASLADAATTPGQCGYYLPVHVDDLVDLLRLAEVPESPANYMPEDGKREQDHTKKPSTVKRQRAHRDLAVWQSTIAQMKQRHGFSVT